MPADLSFRPDDRAEEQYQADRVADQAAALEREHAGYVQRGLDDRAAQVADAYQELTGQPLTGAAQSRRAGRK